MLCNASPRKKNKNKKIKQKKKNKKNKTKQKEKQITMVIKDRAMKHKDHVRNTHLD